MTKKICIIFTITLHIKEEKYFDCIYVYIYINICKKNINIEIFVIIE